MNSGTRILSRELTPLNSRDAPSIREGITMGEIMTGITGFELEMTSGTRRMYRSADGALAVEVSDCEYDRSANSLMTLWVKRGYVPRHLDRTLGVQTYLRRDDGTQVKDVFNPQVTDKREIDFGWMLAASEENEHRLLAEVARRYIEWKADA